MEDTLRSQVVELGRKVDKLCTLVDRLNTRFPDSASENLDCSTDLSPNSREEAQFGILEGSRRRDSSASGDMGHKDILLEGSNSRDSIYQAGEVNIAPEIQVQRLTAQLTAAYNRIAALEEQLLSFRIHS